MEAKSLDAANLIAFLHAHEQVITIKERPKGIIAFFSRLESFYNPHQNAIFLDTKQGKKHGVPSDIVLGHELIHAYHDLAFNRNSDNTSRKTIEDWAKYGIPGLPNSNSECSAIPNFSENSIRKDYGLQAR